MAKVFYVSDHHFYHELALKRSRQQFKSVDEMNKEMIRRHNEKVSKDDDVYILGDVIVCPIEELAKALENTVGRLNGNLHLITGNHDYKYLDNPEFRKYFKSIDEALLIHHHKSWIQMCHYPMILWYKKNKGAYHVFGHMHNEQVTKEYNIIKNEDHALSACVEINNYEPCELKELIKNNEIFRNEDNNKDSSDKFLF